MKRKHCNKIKGKPELKTTCSPNNTVKVVLQVSHINVCDTFKVSSSITFTTVDTNDNFRLLDFANALTMNINRNLQQSRGGKLRTRDRQQQQQGVGFHYLHWLIFNTPHRQTSVNNQDSITVQSPG